MKLLDKILGWFKSKPAAQVDPPIPVQIDPPAAAPQMEVTVTRTPRPKRVGRKYATPMHKKTQAMKWAHTISGYKEKW